MSGYCNNCSRSTDIVFTGDAWLCQTCLFQQVASGKLYVSTSEGTRYCDGCGEHRDGSNEMWCDSCRSCESCGSSYISYCEDCAGQRYCSNCGESDASYCYSCANSCDNCGEDTYKLCESCARTEWGDGGAICEFCESRDAEYFLCIPCFEERTTDTKPNIDKVTVDKDGGMTTIDGVAINWN